MEVDKDLRQRFDLCEIATALRLGFKGVLILPETMPRILIYPRNYVALRLGFTLDNAAIGSRHLSSVEPFLFG